MDIILEESFQHKMLEMDFLFLALQIQTDFGNLLNFLSD